MAKSKTVKRKATAKPAARKASKAGKAATVAKPKSTARRGKKSVQPAAKVPTAAGKTGVIRLAQAGNHKGKKRIVSAAMLKGYDKAAPTPNGDNGNHLSESQLRKIKSGLGRKDLNHYRELLQQKRAEILHDVESLQADAQNSTGGSISYEHMADAGSDNFEQEFTLGLVETERKLLREIDEALLRIQAGTYGVCLERGIPITRERLDAKPWARYCIEVAREREKFQR